MGKRLTFVMMMIVVAAVVVTAEEAQAPEDVPAYVEFDQGLGFSGGELSGFGISYRNWLLPTIGIQICAGALYFPADLEWYPGNLLDYWVSLEGMRALYATEFTSWLFGQLYLFVGLHHSGYIPLYAVWGTVEDGEFTWEEITGYEQGVFTPRVGLGLGLGVEVGLFRHLSGTFELGYAVFWEAGDGTFVDQLSVDLVPQGSFHFRY